MRILYDNPLKVLLIFGLIYRIIVIYFYGHISMFPDSEGYIGLADLISSGNTAGYDGTRSFGYPLLLTLLANNLSVLVLLQLFIGILGSIFVYKNLILLKFSVGTSLIISLFLESFLHVAFYETAVLTESLTLFLLTIIFNIILSDYFERKSTRTNIILGLLLAYLVSIKPFYIFLPFIIYSFFILKNVRWKSFKSSKSFIILLPVITFLSISYNNKINTGYFVPTTFYGFNIAQNCVFFAEKAPLKDSVISKIYVRHRQEMIREEKDVAMAIWSAYPELQAKTKLSLPELSFELSEFSKATIAKNPLDYLKQVARSWWEFWRTNIYWNGADFRVKSALPFFETIWDLQHYVLKLFKILYVLSLPFLFYRFLLTRKIDVEIIISLIIFSTSILQAITTFGSNSRFSFPFEFMMVIIVFLQIKRLKLLSGKNYHSL